MTPAIELQGISKAFGPVQANKDIALKVLPGTIHGIIGENGAGKSTLMSILYGFYRADAGEIRIHGTPVTLNDSQAAIAAGIGMVFQHFKLVENFSVLENVILGAEDGRLLRPSLAKARKELRALAHDYGLNVDPDACIEDLGVGFQQRVEILKALYRKADILILDEATQGLDQAGSAAFYHQIEMVRRSFGCAVLMVSHELHVVMAASDRVVCLNGHVCCQGTPELVASAPEYRALFGTGTKGALALYRHEHNHSHEAEGCTDPSHTHTHTHPHTQAPAHTHRQDEGQNV